MKDAGTDTKSITDLGKYKYIYKCRINYLRILNCINPVNSKNLYPLYEISLR
jgi:hypothetical protein